MMQVMEVEDDGGTLHYLVHYAGWNNRYDEWVQGERILVVLEKGDSTNKAKMTKGHLSKNKVCCFCFSYERSVWFSVQVEFNCSL